MAAHFSYTLTVQLEYTNHLLQFFKLFSYYAGIMLNAFSDLLCSKLCWHNRLIPSYIATLRPQLNVWISYRPEPIMLV